MHKTLLLTCLLFGGFPFTSARAGQVWQWVDDQGRQQFSDTRPAMTARRLQALDLPDRPAHEPAGGLRPGEVRRLHAIEQRDARRRRAVTSERERSDRLQATHRATCRETRDRWRSTRDRNRRKEYSNYLRVNCW
jgi:hypothetical protein